MKRVFTIIITFLFHTLYSSDSMMTMELPPSVKLPPCEYEFKRGTPNGTGVRANGTMSHRTQAPFSGRQISPLNHLGTPQYNLGSMSTPQLQSYFIEHQYTEDQILNKAELFLSAAYLAIAKRLPKYPEYVKKFYNEYRNFNFYTKLVGRIFCFYIPGLQKKFTELHQECEKQQAAQKERARKERAVQAEKEARQKATVRYCAQLDALTYDNHMMDAIPSEHQHARIKAHAHIKTTALDRVTKHYTLNHETITFAQEYDIAASDLHTLCGNTYEQQLHTEFLEQLTEVHSIATAYALQPKNILIDAVGYGISIGMEANRLQKPATATAWANLGWKTLEIIEGVGEGLLLCAANTAHSIQNPKDTVIEFVYALGTITGYCARAIGTVAYWHELMEQGNALLVAQEMDDLAHKIALCETLCVDKLSQLSAHDVAKNLTYLVTDIAITHKMVTLGSRLFSELKLIVFDLIKNIRKEEELVEFTLQSVEEFGNIGKISFLMEEEESSSIKKVVSSFKEAKEELTIEVALERWQKSESLKRLEQQCAQLGDKVSDIRIGLYENKPNISFIEYEKLEKMALQKYEEIRHTLDDINAIATNTGLEIDIIKQIKEHVFINEHILWDGIKQFPPDINMANAWERLISNKFLKSDLEFLKHEYAESILMGKCEVSWRIAHDITDEAYNWIQYLEGKM